MKNLYQVVTGFLLTFFKYPKPWFLWVAILVLVNLGGGLFFLHTPEGQVVAVTFLVQVAAMIFIYSLTGFGRLLGLAHFGWFILIGWLFLRFPDAEPGLMKVWVLSVLVINFVSLILDVMDVIRWINGERAPLYE